MGRPPHRHDAREAARIERLRGFAILDTPQEREFDTIVLLAQKLLGVPIALVSLVDEHRQWFKAKCGLSASETERGISFCTHAVEEDDIMVVEDATRDPRFADNPFVTGEPGVRFYAGVPLRPPADGHSDDLPGIGTLCVVDTKARTLSPDDANILRELAALVSALICARANAAAALIGSEELRRRSDMLERQQVQLRQAERMAGIASWRLDIAEQSIHWSDHVYAIHGLPIGEMPSFEEAMAFYPVDRRAEIAALLERGATQGVSFDFESDFMTADGRRRRVRSIGEPQLVDGQPVAMIGVFQDITDRHAREQSLRLTADTDALTGLHNRAWFEKELANAAARHRASGDSAHLILFDLDGFKGINDTFGHAAGDDILRLIADRARRLASGGLVARQGGDEFVILVTRPCDCANIETVISDLLATLRHTVERDGQRRAVSATVGAAAFDAAIAQPSELMRRADIALYEAKRAERGTGRIFGSGKMLRPTATARRAA